MEAIYGFSGSSPLSKPIQLFISLRFLDEVIDSAVVFHLQDPQAGSADAVYRLDSDRYIGFRFFMFVDELAIVHAIKMIASQNEHIFRSGLPNFMQLFANCVGGPLVPIAAAMRLFRGQDLHPTWGERYPGYTCGGCVCAAKQN